MQKERNNFKIDFIGIGAVKCATTWISKCLDEHPQICLSRIKEVRFFNNVKKYRRGIDWYKSYFKNCPDDSIKGEFTPGYMNFNQVAERIKRLFPNAKLIVSLRNPIERAYSDYWYSKVRGFELNEFKKAIKENSRYVEWGFYYKKLKPFFELFPKENILVLIYEDITKNPLKFIQKIYHFLGVDKNFIPPSINKKIWTTSENQFPFAGLNRIIIRSIKISKKNIFLKKIALLASSLGLKKVLSLMYRIGGMGRKMEGVKSLPKPPIEESVRKCLQQIYKNDIRNLEKLIGRDLSFWK